MIRQDVERARLACIYQKCKDLNALYTICWVWSTQACAIKVTLEKLVLQRIDGFDHRIVIAGCNTCIRSTYHSWLKAALYSECLHDLHHLQLNNTYASGMHTMCGQHGMDRHALFKPLKHYAKNIMSTPHSEHTKAVELV